MIEKWANTNTGPRFDEFLGVLTQQTEVALDVETTGLDPYAWGASIVSLSVTLPDEDETTYVVPLDHPDGPWGYHWRSVLGEVVDALDVGQVGIVAHNAQFDLRWMQHHALHPQGDDEGWAEPLWNQLVWDTMAFAHLLDENGPKPLKKLASPLMGGDWGIGDDVREAKKVDWFRLAHYNAGDTIATMRLMRAQETLVEREPWVADLWSDIVLPAAQTLAGITHTGIALDWDRAAQALDEAEEQERAAHQWLLDRAASYGMDPEADDVYVSWAANALWFKEFTHHAREADDLIAIETTPTGNPSWRKGVLNKLRLRHGSDVAATLLEQRDGEKRAQFLRSWREHVDGESRIHATYNIARVRSGRLSSSDPNMQQVARALKPSFRASPEKGYPWFVEVDYGQLELRLMAEYIHRDVLPDNPMMQVYRQGVDLHKENATLVTGGRPEDVTKEERQKGKACIAAGELVTTDRGTAPIEFVQLHDRVWDGTEYVTHGGVINRGRRDVLRYDGLRATPDHVVVTEHGEMCHAAAAALGVSLVRAGTCAGGAPDVDGGGAHQGTSTSGADALLGVPQDVLEGLLHAQERHGRGVPVPAGSQVRGPVGRAGRIAREQVRRDGSTMQAWRIGQRELRRPWDRTAVQVSRALHPVGFRGVVGEGHPVVADRPDGQRGSLRAGQPPVGDLGGEQRQPPQHHHCAVHGYRGCPASRVALAEDRPPGLPVQPRMDREVAAEWSDRARAVAAGAQWERATTYDIADAGPRHRFAVSGRLVLNCGFGFNYGMGATKFVTYAEESYGVVFDLDEAERVRSSFFSRWRGLGEWHEHQRVLGRQQGFVETLTGRRRRLIGMYGTSWEQGEAERIAINSPIQGTGSDLMLYALALIDRKVPRGDARLVGTVHDSALLEVSTLDILPAIASLMLTTPVTLTVPLSVDVSYGRHWGEWEDELSFSTLDTTTT